MSKINLTYPLDCHIEHAKTTLQGMLHALQEKYAINHDFVSEHECHLSGAGVDGQVFIKDNEIEVYAKLGFFMAPFKSVIEAEIIKQLDKCFAP